MSSVIVQLLPPIFGSMLAPVWIIAVLLLLASPRGLLKATAFVLGMTVVRLLQGLIFGVVFAASPDAKADNAGSSPVVSTLLVLAGILLLIAAVRTWRKEDDPDAPPPKWMQAIDQLTPLKALGYGAAGTGIALKLWVFTLSAIGIITAADLGQTGGVIAFLAYVVLAQALLILSILVFGVVPGTAPTLRKAIDWLVRYNRPITIAVSLTFGVYFMWDGIRGLLA
jgi:hypothetical protein